MIKLTETQIAVLMQAAASNDAVAVLPERLGRAAAARVGASLVTRNLMREVRSKASMPVWREEGGKQFSLVLLKAGREAAEAHMPQPVRPASVAPAIEARAEPVKVVALPKPIEGALKAPSATAPRQGSKQALLVDMLGAPDGASIDALVAATGWLAHTTRAALTGLRKRGYGIERLRGADGVSRYCLTASAPAGLEA